MSKREDISDAKLIFHEDRGVNEKEWIEYVDSSGKRREALFKVTQIKKDSGDSTYADYAEMIVFDICKKLEVPCADIKLVIRNNKIGCLSFNFLNKNIWTELMDIGTVIQTKREHRVLKRDALFVCFMDLWLKFCVM